MGHATQTTVLEVNEQGAVNSSLLAPMTPSVPDANAASVLSNDWTHIPVSDQFEPSVRLPSLEVLSQAPCWSPGDSVTRFGSQSMYPHHSGLQQSMNPYSMYTQNGPFVRMGPLEATSTGPTVFVLPSPSLVPADHAASSTEGESPRWSLKRNLNAVNAGQALDCGEHGLAKRGK